MQFLSLFFLVFVTAGLAHPYHSKTGAFRVANPGLQAQIPGAYIAVYRNNATSEAVMRHQHELTTTLSKRHVKTLEYYEMSGWRAFSIRADQGVMATVSNCKEIAYVEADAVVLASELLEQPESTPGLARLSHKAARSTSYVFDRTAGAGVSVFVIDTGILPTHSEFFGRASMGVNFVPGSPDIDENGHGTHVSGTIGGNNFGVAKAATIIGVKVLDADGAGSNSRVLAGLNWVTNNVTASKLGGKAVINMSLGGTRSNAINTAVAAATRAGITVVVAAGNENTDASNSSPASAPSAITVGAISALTDVRAPFSNFGTSVDIFAQGVRVLSSSIGSNTATQVLSGTSMASPHVAGLAAYLIGLNPSLATPEDVTTRIKALAVEGGGVVQGPGRGSPTLIAYNGSGQ